MVAKLVLQQAEQCERVGARRVQPRRRELRRGRVAAQSASTAGGRGASFGSFVSASLTATSGTIQMDLAAGAVWPKQLKDLTRVLLAPMLSATIGPISSG